MRIRITGEKSVVDDLRAEFVRHGVQVEPVEGSIDRTELRLGLLEAAAIIGIVANVGTLIKYLIEVAGHLKSGQKSRVEVNSAAGATFIDIDNKSTSENLEKQLAIHETSDRASVPKSDASGNKS